MRLIANISIKNVRQTVDKISGYWESRGTSYHVASHIYVQFGPEIVGHESYKVFHEFIGYLAYFHFAIAVIILRKWEFILDLKEYFC